MHPLAADGRAAPVGQLEPPAMQRADHFALLDPAVPQRPAGMRTTARQGDHARLPSGKSPAATRAASSERPAPSLSSSSRQTATHSAMQPHLSRTTGNRNAKNLGLASEAHHSLDSTLATLRSKAATRHEEKSLETVIEGKTRRERALHWGCWAWCC